MKEKDFIKKKKHTSGGKIALICLAVFVGIIVVSALALYGAAFKAYDNSTSSDFSASWMSSINGDTLLTDLIIPGSHDSATHDMMWMARTQDKTVYNQLLSGTRYLDLRVTKDVGRLVICHGIIKGMELSGVLDEIVSFLDAHAQEGLILDFQHFYEDTQNDVFAMISTKLAGRIVINNSSTPMDFIENLTLDDIRGKCLIIWGSEILPSGSENGVFIRDNDMTARQNSVLHSYYSRKYNTMPTNRYVGEVLDKYIDMFKQENKGLFVLQGQLTDPLVIIGPRIQEAGHNDNMSKYVNALRDSENLAYINIIMRDFVGAKKNMEIVALNYFKGNVGDTATFIAGINSHLGENFIA